MRIFIAAIVTFGLMLVTNFGYAKDNDCNRPGFDCVRIQSGDTWENMFPDAKEREAVKKINRISTGLRPGMRLAVRDDVAHHMTYAPFEKAIGKRGYKIIVFSPRKLAWGAYDANGQLVKWGRASGGKSYCKDVNRSCRTIVGTFTIFHKKGAECVSSKFPLGKGGAPMPHCMYFHRKGYAIHGSPNVPNHNASHGCVRVHPEHARWLNQEFIDLNSTRVIIRPY